MYEQYNPYILQNRLSQLQGQNYYVKPSIKGYPVGCLDEVRGCQIDMDGTITYFPCPSENKIYTKHIDMNGRPVVMCYKQEELRPKEDKISGTIEQLQNKVTELEKMVKELSNRESYVNANANPTVPKSNANVAEPSWEQPYVG